MSGEMDASMSAATDEDAVRKSSRLQTKPRTNVAKMLSEPIPIPKVTPEDRRRMAQMRADAFAERQRPTAQIVVGTDGMRREITVYPCRVCDYLGRTALVAGQHERKIHPYKKKCRICRKYLNSAIDLEKHCIEVHETNTAVMKCTSCDYLAEDQVALDAHTEYEHYTGPKRNEYCRELDADGSPCIARFSQVRELRKHLATEHGLAAATDTVHEEFDNWDEFMRWKAQYELETSSVYKIGYGRRQGQRRYMCVRSGHYKPVPDEMRQRKRRKNGTIKLGFNCTATMICKLPETGGVQVMVHPFHYGHKVGDVPLPGMKPADAPDDWIRPDVRKRRRKTIKANDTEDFTVDMSLVASGGGGGDAPAAVEEGKQDDSQEAATAVAAITASGEASAEAEADPPADAASESQPVPAEVQGGTGDGGTGDSGKLIEVKLESTPVLSARAATLRRRPGPKSKRPPRTPSPPPEPEPEPEPEPKPKPSVRRGMFGRGWALLQPPPRIGPGHRYRKLIRSTRLMKSLRRQLDVQVTRLEEARKKHKEASSASGARQLDSCLVGTPLEDALEVADVPAPLAVLRTEPADIELMPDGVFPGLEVLSAPTDLLEASDTILDLKLEVMELRARLVRRAAVETGLRADALEASARHATTERELRAELERTRAGQGTEAEKLRGILDSVFSPAQQEALQRSPGAAIPWAAEDYERAMALRWMCSQQTFDFVRRSLKVPLPSMAAVRAVAANGRPRRVADTFMELVRTKALEGDTVGEEQEDDEASATEAEGEQSELQIVVAPNGDGEILEVVDSASTTVATSSTTHDHSVFSSPALSRLVGRRAVRRPSSADTPVAEPSSSRPPRRFRLQTSDSEGRPVTVSVREVSGPVSEASVVLARFEDGDGVCQFIGPHSVGASEAAGELSDGAASPEKRPRF